MWMVLLPVTYVTTVQTLQREEGENRPPLKGIKKTHCYSMLIFSYHDGWYIHDQLAVRAKQNDFNLYVLIYFKNGVYV